MKQLLTLFLYFILTLGLSGGFAVYGPTSSDRQRAQTEVLSAHPQAKRFISLFSNRHHQVTDCTGSNTARIGFETQRLMQIYKLSQTHSLPLLAKLGFHYSFKGSELPRC